MHIMRNVYFGSTESGTMRKQKRFVVILVPKYQTQQKSKIAEANKTHSFLKLCSLFGHLPIFFSFTL